MCKNFVVFNFRGWSQPQKLNTDHALYVTLRTSTVGTATMDMHRTLEKERGDKLILLEMVLQSHSLNQLSNVDRTSDRWIGLLLRGVVKSTQHVRSISLVINYRARELQMIEQ